jgi:hypothetical protein
MNSIPRQGIEYAIRFLFYYLEQARLFIFAHSLVNVIGHCVVSPFKGKTNEMQK